MFKYNVFNSNPYSTHQRCLEFTGKNKKVLEVGWATGQISKRLLENICEVTGIEIDAESAQSARKFCKEVIVGDIELIEEFPFPENYFDVMIFADVLEHLKCPNRTLKNFKTYLNHEGSVFVSLPNVCNWNIRRHILLGNFEYKEQGILDSTHIRFFNEKNAKKLLIDNGFEIIYVSAVPGSFSFPYEPIKSKFKFIKESELCGKKLEYSLPKFFQIFFVINSF